MGRTEGDARDMEELRVDRAGAPVSPRISAGLPLDPCRDLGIFPGIGRQMTEKKGLESCQIH